MTSSARSSRRFKPALLPLLLCGLAALCAGAYALAGRGPARSVIIDNPDGSRSTLSVERLKGLELFDQRAGRAVPFTLAAEKTLVVFVSPGDCPTCLDERGVWEQLARSAPEEQFRVVAVLVRTSPAEARAFEKAYALPFTMLVDGESRVPERTELPQITPFKVLVNREGEILMYDGPNNKPSAQNAFRERVAAQLRPASAAE